MSQRESRSGHSLPVTSSILYSLHTRLSWLNRKGFFALLSANFLTQFLGFGTLLLVAKFLNPVELGEIRIIQSYTSLFTIFALAGLNTATLKFCAERRTETDKEHILRVSILTGLAASAIAYSMLGVLTAAGILTASTQLTHWVYIYALTIPIAVMTQLLMVYMQSQKRMNEMARVQVFIRLQSFVLIVACTWLWGFAGFIIATLLSFAVGLLPLIWQVGLRFLRKRQGILPSGFVGVAVFSLLGTGLTTIGQYGDIFILDHSSGDRAAIGYYSLALIFVQAATQVTGTVQAIVTPYFSENSTDMHWVKQQMHLNQVRLIGLSILVAIGVLVMAAILVRTVYGPEYQEALVYLSILMVKFVIWSSYAVIGAAMVGLGLIRYGFVLALIITPLGLLCTYLFEQQWGVPGVAWAQVATAVLTLIMILATYQAELRKYFARVHARRVEIQAHPETP